jgi:hypothetical protein
MTASCAWLAAGATAHAQCPTPGTVTQPCTGGECATLTAPERSAAKGSTVDLPITFEQGTGASFDDAAAIAFTLGIPGTGDAAPLTFDCTDGNLADGSVTGVPANFTAVVENAQCTNRNRCLCPDTGAGQTRDNFVNVVVYGPRDLPEQGPVQIPVLPSGNIVTLRMRVASNAPDGPIPLHIFSALDTGAGAKPQFAANLSLGDRTACDVTANLNRSNVIFDHGQVNVGGTPTVPCVGDCDGGGTVTINELITGVGMSLGRLPLSACLAFNPNNDDAISINELIQGVGNSLNGCP